MNTNIAHPTRITQAYVARLEPRLTVRDRLIIKQLGFIRYARAKQLERLFFYFDGSARARERRCQRTLRRLVELEVLCRLDDRPIGPRGSGSFIYALDVAGQRLAGTGGPAGGQRFRRPWGGRRWLKPDAYARVRLGPWVDRYFIEVYRWDQSRLNLRAKLDSYRHYWQSGRAEAGGGVCPGVLMLATHKARPQALATAVAAQPEPAQMLFQVGAYSEAGTILATAPGPLAA